MKKLLFTILSVCAVFGAATVHAQSAAPTPGDREILQQIRSMTPAERQAYFQAHPEIRQKVFAALRQRYQNLTPAQQAQFDQNHPKMAQHLANASEAGASTTDPGHPRVNEVNTRETDQQQRISQGVASGSLTTGQDTRLENQETRIQNRQAVDMANHDGHLTAAEQLRLNRAQNRESDRIYDDKHD